MHPSLRRAASATEAAHMLEPLDDRCRARRAGDRYGGIVKTAAIEVEVTSGVLRGHRGGRGRPAVLLHGGPAVPDYLGGCAAALDGLFETTRYSQRGVTPSDAGPPYTIESHVSDAIAVLDAAGVERGWAIGHSAGAHIAFHLAIAHPQRVSGLLLIDPLGADPIVLAEQNANLREGLAPEQRVRLDEIDAARRAGHASEADLVERFAMTWPRYFAQFPPLLPPPEHVGVDASLGTNQSIAEHFDRGTLLARLPEVEVPALFVHGENSPIPLRSTTITAALFRRSFVEAIERCGHFSWIERPAAFRTAVERLLER